MTRVNVPIPFSPAAVISAISKQVVFVTIFAIMPAAACARTTVESTPATPSPDAATLPASENAAARPPAVPDAAADSGPDAPEMDATAAWSPLPASDIDGPHELPLEPGRPVWYALRKAGPRPRRLVGHLHGICGPPVYACGKWIAAGVETGVLVCPTGNAKCGDSPVSPASWEAPSWTELVTIMDHDLEASVAKVEAKHKGSIDRSGAILTGYSRGAYAAAVIARLPKNKNRWPYMVLIEANVSLSAASLKAAGVRAVALVAGELGNEISGERATVEALERDGFPARLFVMKKTGHVYSDDMEYVMHDALTWVVAQ
jgi:hypothetical protein